MELLGCEYLGTKVHLIVLFPAYSSRSKRPDAFCLPGASAFESSSCLP